MDCATARLLLNCSGRGGKELAPPEVLALDGHVDACPDCQALAQSERHLDAAFGRAMHAVTIPKGLKGRILQAVESARKPRFWPWVAVAASVVLALGLGAYWFLRPERTLDIPQEIALLEERTGATPEAVEKWFAAKGIVTKAPPGFLYEFNTRKRAYLETYDVATFGGERVPHLLFHFPGDGEYSSALAHVYILPARLVTRNFDPAKFETDFPFSAHRGKLIPHFADAEAERGRAPDYFHLVLYTGESLAPFEKKRYQQ